ncbi:hypothetical protein, partial [Escherichia coli]|uniref:hypothetical protein n=1 Tax=Escherichia coli TaxID=562 RepID=UPI001BC89A4D
WKGWAILPRQKQKKLIMLPSETMIWQPEFTDKTFSRKPGAVHSSAPAFAANTQAAATTETAKIFSFQLPPLLLRCCK